ncbi:MAG: hypothetical protein HYR60_03175 [Acidobacteria bacterium]|nr:hypothetical protein [Acidobacteriota bacterium]
MNCSAARKAIYPSPDRCVLSVETGKALDHVRQCPDCRRYFESQAEWSRLLRAKAGAEPAPDQLRERIAGEIESHQRIEGPRRLGWIAAAALIVVCLPALWFARRIPSQLFFLALCEDHIKYLSADSQLRSSDRAEIESWFRDKTDFGVRVAALGTAEILGSRLCFLRGKKAALVFYRQQGRPVSLFQINRRDLSLAALDRWEVDGAAVWRASFKGYSVAAFEQRGVVYALISDLRESELLRLASAARAEAQGY